MISNIVVRSWNNKCSQTAVALLEHRPGDFFSILDKCLQLEKECTVYVFSVVDSK